MSADPRAYEAQGFRPANDSQRPFVAVSPLFPCRLDDPDNTANSLAHVGVNFFLSPPEARLLAADLLAAADFAEETAVRS